MGLFLESNPFLHYVIKCFEKKILLVMCTFFSQCRHHLFFSSSWINVRSVEEWSLQYPFMSDIVLPFSLKYEHGREGMNKNVCISPLDSAFILRCLSLSVLYLFFYQDTRSLNEYIGELCVLNAQRDGQLPPASFPFSRFGRNTSLKYESIIFSKYSVSS